MFFNVNGFNRIIEVVDASKSSGSTKRPKAKRSDPEEIAAPMPGNVLSVLVEVGQEVLKGETLVVTEAMKMEYCVTAKDGGTVSKVCVGVGDQVESDDLLLVMDLKK